MKIPNAILTLVKGNALKVACKLYSLANAHKTSRNGYEVCIKQTTIADACGLSLSTVKRALSELAGKKIITNRYRITHKNGYQGCYHYSLAFFSNYFYMRNDVWSFDLSAQEFTLYAHYCKLRCNYINSFYQSLNELAEITGMDKRNLCRVINRLIAKGIVAKQLKSTKLGDYTDNTYFVIVRIKGKFKKKSPKLIKHSLDITDIIHRRTSFVNRFFARKAKKCAAFVRIRGSG